MIFVSGAIYVFCGESVLGKKGHEGRVGWWEVGLVIVVKIEKCNSGDKSISYLVVLHAVPLPS